MRSAMAKSLKRFGGCGVQKSEVPLVLQTPVKRRRQYQWTAPLAAEAELHLEVWTCGIPRQQFFINAQIQDQYRGFDQSG